MCEGYKCAVCTHDSHSSPSDRHASIIFLFSLCIFMCVFCYTAVDKIEADPGLYTYAFYIYVHIIKDMSGACQWVFCPDFLHC